MRNSKAVSIYLEGKVNVLLALLMQCVYIGSIREFIENMHNEKVKKKIGDFSKLIGL